MADTVRPTAIVQSLVMSGLMAFEAADAARARGFCAVETLGGPVPIESWAPYGRRDGHSVRFRLALDPALGYVLREVIPPEWPRPCTSGVWRLLRAC